MANLTRADRAQLHDMLQAADDAQFSNRTAVRTYRNALVVAIVALLAIGIAFPFVAAQISSDIVVISTAHSPDPPSVHSLVVSMAGIEVWGLLGGVIAATAGLYRLRSSRSPAGLQLAQLVLKLPAGALTALFGIVLLQSGIIAQLSAADNSKLAAYAVVFGFAQEAFTHFVDRRARELLKSE
jgi:hypothetical protein